MTLAKIMIVTLIAMAVFAGIVLNFNDLRGEYSPNVSSRLVEVTEAFGEDTITTLSGQTVNISDQVVNVQNGTFDPSEDAESNLFKSSASAMKQLPSIYDTIKDILIGENGVVSYIGVPVFFVTTFLAILVIIIAFAFINMFFRRGG